jgi:hypothetical protein
VRARPVPQDQARDEGFDYGLDRVLDGLEVRLARIGVAGQSR